MKESKIYPYSIQEIKEKISSHKLKCTSQRIIIYDALLGLDHPYAEEVYDSIKEANPSISLSTVYNTLESFSEHHLLWKVKTPAGKMRYDVRIEPHVHIYDKEKENVVDYFDEELLGMIKNHLAAKNIVANEPNSIQLLINSK